MKETNYKGREEFQEVFFELTGLEATYENLKFLDPQTSKEVLLHVAEALNIEGYDEAPLELDDE